MTTAGYRDVANDLRAAIDRGVYPAGSSLPHQDDLAERYRLNRNTIRRAIALLHAEGIVVPIRGHGTIIRDRTPVRLPVTRYTEASAEAGPWETACAQQGLAGHTDVVGVSERVADEAVARALGVEAGTTLIHRLNHMYLGTQIAQLQETWLPLSVAAGTPLSAPAKVTGGIYRGLTDLGRPPTVAEEDVTARMPSREEAELLRLNLGSPVLDVRRTSRDREDRPVVHTHVVVAADRVSLSYRQTI